jgi:hypothetical protein
VLGNRRPVAEVQRCRDHLPAQGGKLRGVEQRNPDAHRGQHQEQSGEQTTGPPQPEQAAQSEIPVSVPVAEQKVRDEVARQGEEDAHPQQAPLGPMHVEVVGDDTQHRQRADAIESWYVTPAGLDWSRHV